jgi:UDP-glucose 4-epimerase
MPAPARSRRRAPETMSSQRVLITGLSSHWGGRLAQELEVQGGIEALIGVDAEDPRHEFQRTEFVRVDTDHGLLRRIITAAAIDTVVDTRLITDPLTATLQRAHDVNAAGTRNLIAACGEAGSPVRKLVFKSSALLYGCEQHDPAFFSEDMERSHQPRTALERDVVEAERIVSELVAAHPELTVTILRCAEPTGAEPGGSIMTLLNLPVVPSILGFDPRWQLIHEEDVIGALVHAVRNDLPGPYNAAADGVLALSEIASLLGKPLLPVLPPWGTVFAAAQLRRLGLRIPVEMLRHLRFGQGLDNRRLKASGYSYRYTTREAVLKLRVQQRLRPMLGSGGESYRYEQEVEDFLRWSPSVHAVTGQRDDRPQRPPRPAEGPGPPDAPGAGANGPPLAGYDELSEGELIELISSLEPDALEFLRTYEQCHRRRSDVLSALDQNLERRSKQD